MYPYNAEATTQPSTTPDPPCSAADWVSLQLRREALLRYVPRDSRVLELNAGSGHFTEVLHDLSCRISIADGSLDGLRSNHARAKARGFDASIEGWYQVDLEALDGFDDCSYDAVVAYDGALSYALERRDQALAAYRRVLRPGGVLALDVLSLWGALHRHLMLVVGRDLVHNRAVIRSGDVRGAGRDCHLFRAAELQAFLSKGGFEISSIFASSLLTTGKEISGAVRRDDWGALLEYERVACAERGCLDGGSRIIAVARRQRR